MAFSKRLSSAFESKRFWSCLGGTLCQGRIRPRGVGRRLRRRVPARGGDFGGVDVDDYDRCRRKARLHRARCLRR